MATMTTPSKEAVVENGPRRINPLTARGPLPLSASQENQVKDLYYKRVRGKCADEIRGAVCDEKVRTES